MMQDTTAPGAPDRSLKQRSLFDRALGAQAQQLYTQALSAIVGSLTGATVLAFALWDVVSHSRLLVWLGFVVIVNVLRHRLIVAFRRAKPEGAEAILWGRRFAYTTVPAGVLWGMSALILFPSDSVPHQCLLSIFVAGISCGAVVAYWPSKVTYAPTILAELIPLGGRFFYEGDTTQLMIGCVIFLYVPILIMMANHLNLSNREALRLGLEREELLASLETARRDLETRVAQRTAELTKANELLREEIHRRELLEVELRVSEQKYRALSENIPCVVYSVLPDEHFTNVFVSGRIEELTGYSVGEILKDPARCWRVIHPDDREHAMEKIEEHRRQKSALDVEYRIVTRAGDVKWTRDRANPALDDNGEITSISGFIEDITERRKAQQELVKERNFSTWILDSLPGTFYLFDAQGMIIRWNTFLERASGYSSEEIGSMHVLDFFPEDEKAKLQDAVREVFTRGETYVEAEWLTRGGQRIPYYFSARRVYVEDRPHLIGVGIDIRDRKGMERALEESEEKYRRIFESSIEGIFQTSADGRLITANPAFARMFRYASPEEIVSEVTDIWAQLYSHCEQREEFKRLLNAPGPLEDYQVECLRRDGTCIWVSVNAYAVRDESGKIVCYEGTTEDITARKKSEEALQESEARYRSLFNDSKDGVYVTGRNGQIVDCNQAFLDLFGYQREEIIGANIKAVYVNPRDRDRFVQEIEGGGFLKDFSLSFRRKDGKEMDCLLTASLRRSGDGSIVGYHGIIRDVTEQKNLQSQLLQAQKMEAIGTLAGGIAHDFNNLLTVIIGFSELLLTQKKQDHPDYADLQKIAYAAENGADLVQRLLMFSRKSQLKPVSMNLNEHIVQVEKLLRRTIPKMVDIHLDLSAGLARIYADPSQVEQVLLNLALNARDAMSGVGKLTVRTAIVTLDEEYGRLHVEARSGEYVLLEVSDTGHGMDDETVEHIFEPFFTTKEMGRGTGLGLAMVYGIVKQHGGFITVHSKLGKGATFRVHLPAMPADVEPEVEDSTISPGVGTETLLLVDDEELVRELAAQILTKHGYTVLQAANGREALNLFRKEGSRISLVVLDLIMPEMGGTECLKELLKMDASATVLIASGYSADASVKETIKMGAKGFVRKPFRLKELLRDVRRVLDEG